MCCLISGLLIFSVFLSSCAPKVPDPEKDPAGYAHARVKMVEDATRALGVYYRGSEVRAAMLAAWQEISDMINVETDPDTRFDLKRTRTHLMSFLGLLLMEIFHTGELVYMQGEQADGGAQVIKRVDADALEALHFFSFEGDLLNSVQVIQFYEARIKEDPSYSFAHSGLAMFYLGLTNFDQAITLADRARALNRDDFFALRTLLVALGHIKKREEEIPALVARYAKVSGNKPAVYFLMSQVYSEAGNLPRAIEYGEKALEKVRNPQFTAHLARLYELSGNLEKARYHYASMLHFGKLAGRTFHKYTQDQVDRMKALIAEKVPGDAAREKRSSLW